MMDRLVFGNAFLKIVVIVQVIFSTWGFLSAPDGTLMPENYAFIHSILLLFGALSITTPENSDVVLMYLAVNIFSILNDIILLSLYQPAAEDVIKSNHYGGLSTYRFALGMSIVNLLLKVPIIFILYRIYQTRGGDLKEEISRMRASGSSYNGYNQIDESSGNRSVETASPHQSLDNSTGYSTMQ